MFILRKISANPEKIFNQIIGDNYEYITKFSNPKEFDHIAELYWGKKEACPETNYGFISTNDKNLPLFEDNWYYIMTDNGQTFERLKYFESIKHLDDNPQTKTCGKANVCSAYRPHVPGICTPEHCADYC